MDRPTFTKLLDQQFDRIRELNSTKGVEYSGHDDVLSDFRVVADQVGITPEQALITYATKHWRAINAYVQTGEVKSEPIQGRILDEILYMLLLLAMVEDKDENEDWHDPNQIDGAQPPRGSDDEFLARADGLFVGIATDPVRRVATLVGPDHSIRRDPNGG